MSKTQAAMREAERTLGDSGRILVRWSGTEPKLRVMVEGEDEATIKTLAMALLAAAKEDMAGA
jgi:phosphoglucosamine mutase